ncbi:MAG: mitochondrial fission ELM1 family protein [Proteobacteria bacterium]|nr:mitochondrial fission ELM1 family protein [Pseudomonadota bacterium]
MSVLTREGGMAAGSPQSRSGLAPGVRRLPVCLVLGVRHGVTPSPRPTVRIYLGTEPAHYRATRIFVYSIERVRDPSRVYEIYLMSDLADFRRLFWLTGFTNYRFAIPHFAGAAGRAIYNDVDQVYLSDPAELFDAEMGGHGFLTISPSGRIDTSVMLMDAARMAAVWPIQVARQGRKNGLIERARAIPGLIGGLAPEWNARDGEYRAGRSKLLHFTGLHTQPWRPSPERFVYADNPVGAVWHELERDADGAGYQLFDFARPSACFIDMAQHPASDGGGGEKNGDAQDLIQATGAETVREYRIGDAAPDEPCHGMICGAGLERFPDGDVAWIVEALFAKAERFILARIAATRRAPSWWFALFEAIGARHPELRWRLVIDRGHGGVYRRDNHPPKTVWVLDDGKPGHTTQSIGLAEALGWPYEIKKLAFTPLAGFGTVLRSSLGATLLGVDRAGSDELRAPWPDVAIATGWRSAPVTRWIGEQSRGHTRTIQLGRKGGRIAEVYDAVIACKYFRLPPHPRRIETTAPLNRVSAISLARAREQSPDLFEGAARPRVALLMGGSSRRHSLGPGLARRIGAEVRAFAEEAGGSVFAVTSRRTGDAATDALSEGLGAAGRIDRWRDGRRDNPYLAALALADVIVVTGESESMLAEAVACGKPVYIYPVPEKPPGPWARIEEAVVGYAYAALRNRRGTLRPQRGLQRLCARLITRGLVQPRRNLDLLHEDLIARGYAHAFGAPLERGDRPRLDEAREVAAKIRALWGMPG